MYTRYTLLLVVVAPHTLTVVTSRSSASWEFVTSFVPPVPVAGPVTTGPLPVFPSCPRRWIGLLFCLLSGSGSAAAAAAAAGVSAAGAGAACAACAAASAELSSAMGLAVVVAAAAAAAAAVVVVAVALTAGLSPARSSARRGTAAFIPGSSLVRHERNRQVSLNFLVQQAAAAVAKIGA